MQAEILLRIAGESVDKVIIIGTSSPGGAESITAGREEELTWRRVSQVPVQSWFDDLNDTELLDLLPFFEGLSKEKEVYGVLQNLRGR